VERFELDGYVVEELLGFGATGEVWRAREVATGEPVALKRLRPRGATAVDRIRREAGLLAQVAGQHVIGVRRLVVDDDETVIVMDLAAGGSLAAVMAARGRLPAPEVVTTIAPVCAALAAGHSHDLVHGNVTASNIVFSADGRPLLADFGVARAMGIVDAGGAAEDIRALGLVALAALTGQPDPARLSEAPGAVAEVVAAMIADDPYDRPDARSAGNRLLRASRVAPVGLIVPTPTAVSPPGPAHRTVQQPRSPADDDESWSPWRRRIVVAGAAGLAVTGAIGVGVSLAASHHHPAVQVQSHPPVIASSPSPSPSLSPTPSPPDWRKVVTHLDALRAAAFSEGDAAALAGVYAPGAAAYSTDLATLSSLQSRGLHAQGFSATVEAVTVVSETSTMKRLRVVDRLSSYLLVDDTGAVVGHGPARPPTAYTMTLTSVAGRWRVAAVRPV
jgi:serine/threonine protein kinase